MTDFEEVMMEYAYMQHEDRLAAAKKAIANLIPACKKVDKKNNGLLLLFSIMLTAIGADGGLTELEYDFVKDVLGVHDDAVSKFIDLYDSRMAELVDRFASECSLDAKADMVILVLCIASADLKISREETALLYKLLD